MRSQTTTTATTLPSGRVGRCWCDVLNSTNSHTRSSQSSEGRMSTWTWGLCAVATGGPDLDVQSSDAQLLASSSNVLSGQHSSVWGGLVTVGLDFHASSNSADGFAAGEIGNMYEGVVEGREDSCDAENKLAF